MTENERFDLWQTEDISKLTDEMMLVRNILSGQLMVKRTSHPDALGLMQTLCGIRHPNLMAVYDADLVGGKCVSLGEYIQGTTLEDAVKQQGVFSEPRARDAVGQICSGLTALHQANIIHRDIKPSNIMIDRNGRIKIIDYDIVRIKKEDQNRDTEFFGTREYAAPEQYGYKQTDQRTDVYSCGAVLNFLLTGKPPLELLYEGEAAPIIKKCIELDPENRYDSAAHLRAVLINDQKYFRNHRYDEMENLRFRPLPGFRSKRVFPKIITVIGMILYVLCLSVHIGVLADPSLYANHSVPYYMTHVFLIAVIYGFWTLFPYLLFGDIGKYTKRFSEDIGTRRVIKKVFGWMSIVVGTILLIVMFALYNKGILQF